MPELYIKETVIEYYPAAVITEPRVFIKAKLIISIDAFYILIKNREDIKTENT
jgi:uncharacterized membrane protein